MSMLHKFAFLAVALSAAVCCALKVEDTSCPTVSPISGFNLPEWIRATWYIQQQQINGYQKAEDLFCVTATYNHTDKHVPFFDGPTIGVHNYANKDVVNGKSEGGLLCARQPHPASAPGKLEVAPCFLPNLFSGPYWPVLAGPSNDNYEWAVVSGGQPKVRVSPTTCTTTEKGINGAGLWIFSRNSTMANGTLTRIHEMMNELGIATTKLVNVPQVGCNYDGAYIKPNNQ